MSERWFLRKMRNAPLSCAVPALVAFSSLAGCSFVDPSDGKLACESAPDLNGNDRNLALPEARKAQALVGIELAKKVGDQAKSAWLGTGALSGTLSRVPGTEAIGLAINIRHLRTMIANQKAIDLAIEMDGKSPLPPKTDWACQKLANSVASLDTGQSDDQFLESVTEVEAYFKRVYETNGGQYLNSELNALKPMETQQ